MLFENGKGNDGLLLSENENDEGWILLDGIGFSMRDTYFLLEYSTSSSKRSNKA